jgi:hypothetical protein
MKPETKARIERLQTEIRDLIDTSDGTAGDGFHADKLAERIVPDALEEQARQKPAVVILLSMAIGAIIGAALMFTAIGRWLIC